MFERSPGEAVAAQHMLTGATSPKPELPARRGALTIQDVRTANDVAADRAADPGWAESTWDAYREQHQIARDWIDTALATRRGR